MSRRLAVAGLVAVLIAAAGVGAFASGFGPAPGGNDEAGSFPTATATPTPATADGTARPAFAFAIERVDKCGRTCRDVTTTLRNGGDASATGVVVHTRVFAGNGTDGDVVWSGTERVGRLAAGGSHTATRRVELSYREGLAVRRADGWITVQTTVESDQRTVTFTDRRDVA
ncbi:MAG: hypothetical protein ABEH40_00895 [Haloferacaceae archaeon]